MAHSFPPCITAQLRTIGDCSLSEVLVVDDAQGIEKILLSHVWAPLESEVKSLKKVKKLTFFK